MNEQELLADLDDLDDISENELEDNAIYVDENEAIENGIEIDVGFGQEDPQYKLLLQANKTAVDIDNEIYLIHKFIRDIYSQKFPELEGSVLNMVDYIKAVQLIKNETDVSKVNLQQALPASTVMTISVAASTTTGKPLNQHDLDSVLKACDMALELENIRWKILAFVESKMTFLAPNLSALLGTSTAAKLMGVAGGLLPLSRLPGNTIQILGSQKKHLSGFSSASVKQHVGFIYEMEFIKRLPKELKMKAQRVIAYKAALAARVDACKEAPDGSVGRNLKQEIDSKFEKFQEPPPLKKIKALPTPTEGRKSKRGGKRVRRQKETFAVTELRKLQNRVQFGVQEEEIIVGDTVKGLGLIKGASGRVRTAATNDKLREKIKKTRQLKPLAANESGLATSIAFTPVQGFELYNPEIAKAEKEQQNSSKYFGNITFKKPTFVPK
ncbi:Nop domain-containing protein [Rozella allomycis CSF55]|uniref:Nop domain-containing protein n=1 Tax=Rozella allomycis (strain CSF55) TaxID=988480 RepID=A0A4P9YG60_ROZAC|nr:Nop domain-containing protein [Rozella allomycis CSF55]